MPVIGHALVGAATAALVRPARPQTIGAAVWLPAMLALAYLPDIAAQAALLVGLGNWRWLTHTLLFAAVAAAALAPLLARMGRFSLVRAGLLAFVAVGLHDVCDLLQGSDRWIFWPFARDPLPRWFILPRGLRGEGLVFGTALAAALLAAGIRRLLRPPAAPWREPRPMMRLVRVGAWGASLAIAISAAFTAQLKLERGRQIEAAKQHIFAGRYARSLPLIDAADRWPQFYPGMVAFYRGRAHLGLGELDAAETAFLRCRALEAGHTWALVNLIDIATRRELTGAQRAALVDPLLAEFRVEGPGQPDYARMEAVVAEFLRRPVRN